MRSSRGNGCSGDAQPSSPYKEGGASERHFPSGIDEKKISHNVCHVGSQVGGQRRARITGRPKNGGENHGRRLRDQAESDHPHIALRQGDNIRCGPKPDGQGTADQLYAKKQQESKY